MACVERDWMRVCLIRLAWIKVGDCCKVLMEMVKFWWSWINSTFRMTFADGLAFC